jgi:small subunit ribosomal protein S18
LDQIEKRKMKFVKKHCRICQFEKQIDYKDVDFLKSFLNRRGRIISRLFTGNCAKHQRAVTRAIKRARNLALLPFTV